MDIAKVIHEMCKDEHFSHHVYKFLAKSPLVSEKLKIVLEKAAEDEFKHYSFWKNIVGECASRISMFKVLLFTAIFYLFGLTVTLKFIESKEYNATELYKNIIENEPGLKDEVDKIIRDEERHEKEFASNIDEGRVKYIGSITLGISDALVELTGIYTGSLGAFENTLSAGLTGLLAGIAASISMGIASYAQAKHEGRLNPKMSAFYTAIAYLIVVLVLALPYFLIGSLAIAFVVMLTLAIAVVAYITFYASVLHDRKYLREFTETTLLIFGVSILLYVLGSVLGTILGVKQVD
ncbi:MAG: VIT1/CCC1 family protein [Ignisphaera sp.]